MLFGGILLLGALAPGGFAARVVLSGSMEPAIPTGAVVFTLSQASYYEGDVITYQTIGNSVPTTHRVVSVEEGTLGNLHTTRGDANDVDDFNRVRQNSIYGKVLFHIPYLGFILDFAKTSIGFLLLVGFPILFIIIEEIKNIVAEVKKNRKEKSDSMDNSKTS